MPDFTYPDNALRSGPGTATLLGGFWSYVYGGRSQVADYALARGSREIQTLRNLSEAVDAVGRTTAPVYHREEWFPLTIKESERTTAPPITYGDSSVYGNQPVTGVIYQYGGPSDTSVAYPIPAGLISAPMITASTRTPAAAWTSRVDYLFQPSAGKLLFRDDPLDDPGVTIQPVYASDGLLIDREATLWLWQADFNWNYIRDHFGYTVNLFMPSSPAYKELVNCLFDTLVTGPSIDTLTRALSALTGAPTALGGETVEAIFTDANSLWIVTDRNAYAFNKAATPVVSVNSSVQRGDRLVDAFRIDSLHNGTIPDDLMALDTGPGILVGDYSGPLTWTNEEVIVSVTTSMGHLKVAWPLGGELVDVDRFWDEVHLRGIASGKTLAEYLGLVQTTEGEGFYWAFDYVGSYLPTDYWSVSGILGTVSGGLINPLEFLIGNLLRNVILVRVNEASFAADAPGIANTDLLRRLVPPQFALIIVEDE